MDSRDADLYELIAETPSELEDVCSVIRDNDLELVAVVAIAQPRIADADGELILLFGSDTAADTGSAA